ncbi:MAG: hypothetical protein J6J24_01885, partial [Clostridia bacterium]|nr:hypothetical protein [Clostridia bacterium]
GQINAVQSWYLFQNEGDNEHIDAIVRGYKGLTFNEAFAIGNFMERKQDQREKFAKIVECLAEVVDEEIPKFEKEDGWLKDDLSVREKARYEALIEERNSLVAELKRLPVFIYFNNACLGASEQAKTVRCPLCAQRYVEMKSRFIDLTPFNAEKESLTKWVKKNMKRSMKRLLKVYEEKAKEDKNATVRSIPQISFALGKAIVFSEDIKNKTRDAGVKILQSLATRDFSNEFVDYQLKEKTSRMKDEQKEKTEDDESLVDGAQLSIFDEKISDDVELNFEKDIQKNL